MSKVSKKWTFTLNNYSDEEYEFMVKSEKVFLIMGKEVAPDTLTPHLQGFIYFKTEKSLKQMKKLSSRAHWEMAMGNVEQNITYCSKEGNFEQWGNPPLSQAEKGAAGKAAITERWELAKAGRFEELPPEQLRMYEYIHRRNLNPIDRVELDNEWIHGTSGCGKSRYIRDEYGSCYYSKPMSKWWDGYNGEDVVVLDDFDPTHGVYLGYFLKIWTDHYTFNAEIKGGMIKIRPKKIIVTSQYSLPECFTEQLTVDALIRRFKRINMTP